MLLTHWPCYVSLGGLPLCGQPFVAPRHFHFTIIALKFDQGRSSWHRNFTSYDSGLFEATELFILNSKCLSMDVSWLYAEFYASVGVAETPNLYNYDF